MAKKSKTRKKSSKKRALKKKQAQKQQQPKMEETQNAVKKETTPDVTKETSEHKIVVEEKKDKLRMIKKILSLAITLLIIIFVIWVGITIKNGLDDTMEIVTEDTKKLCGDKEACIVLDGYYEDEFANWNIRDYWPFFGISIQTFEEIG